MAYQRLSSERFSWTFTRCDRGLTTVLTDNQLNRSKVFFQAGSLSEEHMNEHMNTLTDELCESFWPRERVKKEKKNKGNANAV